MFYFNVIPRSNFFKTIQHIFEKIEPVSLWRVKANLFTTTPNIMKHEFHVDMINISEGERIEFGNNGRKLFIEKFEETYVIN